MLRLYQPPLICTMVFFTRWLEILGEFVFFLCQTRQQEKALTPCVYCTPTNLADVGSIPTPSPSPSVSQEKSMFHPYT